MKRIVKTTLVIGALLATGIALAGPLMGRGGCDRGHHGPEGAMHGVMSEQMMDHLSQKLELTDVQRQSVDAIVADARPRMRELGEALRDGRQSLLDMARDGNTSESAIRTMAEQQGDYVTEMIMTGVQLKMDVYNVLDELQRDQVDRWLDKRAGHGHRHF